MYTVEQFNEAYDKGEEYFNNWIKEQEEIEKAIKQSIIKKKDQMRWAFEEIKSAVINNKEKFGISKDLYFSILKKYNVTHDEMELYEPSEAFLNDNQHLLGRKLK